MLLLAQLLVFFTIFALPPIVLVFGDSVAIQIFLLADMLLLALLCDETVDYVACLLGRGV